MDLPRPRIAYLFSRFPVVSQTFCDSEMLALEARGFDLDVASINPPPNAFRHERYDQFAAEAFYPPPPEALARLKSRREKDGTWPARFGDLIARHDRDYGPAYKASTRARNALYFAELFQKRGVRHIHVHFANRATHTALFIKQWAGIPFSFTAHAQDFMVDLGSDDLLRELCREAEFIIGVSDHSCGLLRRTCPGSVDKIHRVYNGIAMDQFPAAPIGEFGALRIVSIGRLIEFKGFHHLAAACAQLQARGIEFHWTLVGEGPWRERLETQVSDLGIGAHVTFAGVQSQESIKKTLAASDVFCLPCIVDSKGASDILPTVITEAMACSLPVVSTQLVGVPEMVISEETGLLVPPGDETALADALARLANDRDLARRFGRAGRARAERVFELRETSRQLAAHFDACLAAAERIDPPAPGLLYVIDAWPPAPGDDSDLGGELAALAAIGEGPLSDATLLGLRCNRVSSETALPDWAEKIEFFPDALVLEAEWAAHPDIVARVIDWRDELGSGIDTENYLFQARRALHLARLIRKRRIGHVHATRSAVAVTAWLAARLTGAAFSAAFEADADLGSATIDRLAADAALVSRADDAGQDHLCLRPADRSRRLVLGPLKTKLPGEKPAPDRTSIYREWFRQLEAVVKTGR